MATDNVWKVGNGMPLSHWPENLKPDVDTPWIPESHKVLRIVRQNGSQPRTYKRTDHNLTTGQRYYVAGSTASIHGALQRSHMSARITNGKTKQDGLGLHRRQLFHWIGSDLENNPNLSAAARAKTYVDYLRGSLRNGLWVRLPRIKETFGPKQEFKLELPICCFTETTLDEIEFHNRSYGRLGLGFPKRFVLAQGGKPINYINAVTRDPSFKAWVRLGNLLSNERLKHTLPAKEWNELKTEFVYLSSFLKMMKPVRKPAQETAKRQTRESGEQSKPREGRERVPSVNRHYGNILQFIEEREWRIVHNPQCRGQHPRDIRANNAAGIGNDPPWYLPYRPAHDLFTVVLPDARTKYEALQDDEIRGYLWPKNGPPVTILSLDDLSTF